MRKFLVSILIGLMAALSATPGVGLAAQILYEPDTIALPKSDNYTVTLLIDTQGESINAIEGTLLINSSAGNVVAVSDSGSVVTYWINRPELNAQQRTVEFRGAIPGGYTGKGILFSLVMPRLEKSSIQKPFTITNFRALRNDGLGSPAQVSVAPFSFGQYNAKVADATDSQLYIDDKSTDNVAPEVFAPQISRDDRVYDGKWFITFATQDKQSGIDHYEIQETRSGRISAGEWKPAESPYLLEDQELHSFVYVLAIDRHGNERVIKVFPRNPLPWVKQSGLGLFVVLGVIIIAAAGLLIYRLKRNKRRAHKA